MVKMDEQGLIIIRCPTCRGSGKRLFLNNFRFDVPYKKYEIRECNHCNGSGYLERDWVSAVYEKPVGDYVVDGFVYDGHTFRAEWPRNDWVNVQEEIVDKMAQDLANSIDTEILKMMKGDMS